MASLPYLQQKIQFFSLSSLQTIQIKQENHQYQSHNIKLYPLFLNSVFCTVLLQSFTVHQLSCRQHSYCLTVTISTKACLYLESKKKMAPRQQRKSGVISQKLKTLKNDLFKGKLVFLPPLPSMASTHASLPAIQKTSKFSFATILFMLSAILASHVLAQF